ncbi:MAG: proteinral L-amino acid transport system permease protein [Rhodocyclaceae bacterium]|nr:MAG: proteinral L-amino acid transport system permease protein [Rhodocyclaceae bacterium]TND02342.1 MAG: proteinral L-amino acid transport system permease protein [Rhodocyclaceae bacterium]
MNQIAATQAWLRRNLFSDAFSGLTTLLLLGGAVYWLPGLIDWMLLQAVFEPDAAACQTVNHAGACWGVVAEKYRFILFGRYPHAEQWRPLLATALLLAVIFASGMRLLNRKFLLTAWALALPAFFILMGGGSFGLTPVGSDQWGGLPLTLLLATMGMLLAFPLAIMVALGRQSGLPLLRGLCTLYVELVRGVPLISVLFLASFLFPIILPQGFSIDVLLRVQAGIVLFAAAYLSETIRGGLQAVPGGQHDAAAALGLGRWQAMRWIILPQALRAVVPSMMNSAVSVFKDTSLVTVVSLYELTGSLSLALAGDAEWRSFHLEGYLFIGGIYWIGCYSMSRFSRGMESKVGAGATAM